MRLPPRLTWNGTGLKARRKTPRKRHEVSGHGFSRAALREKNGGRRGFQPPRKASRTKAGLQPRTDVFPGPWQESSLIHQPLQPCRPSRRKTEGGAGFNPRIAFNHSVVSHHSPPPSHTVNRAQTKVLPLYRDRLPPPLLRYHRIIVQVESGAMRAAGKSPGGPKMHRFGPHFCRPPLCTVSPRRGCTRHAG